MSEPLTATLPVRLAEAAAVDDEPAARDLQRFTRDHAAGDVVFAAGSRGQSMFVVIEGSVRVEAGGELLTTLGVGQSFGEIALVDEGLRTATVVAAESPTRLVEIDKARFVYLVGQQPAFALTVLRSLARRIKALTGEVEAAGKTAPPGP